MRVLVVPILEDNYAYLLIDPASGVAAAVDPAEPGPVLERAKQEGIAITAILTTHHHPDHSGGNRELAAKLPGIAVYGSAEDGDRIPALTHALADGEVVRVGKLEGRALFVPCHTRGHVAYLFGKALFAGDTLFAAGCGRFFEGTAADMHHALQDVLGALPDDTLLHPGHEYTQKNLEFAATLEPENPAIIRKLEEVRALRRRGLPSIPTTLGEERSYNPFLRTSAPELLASVARVSPGVDVSDPVRVLAAVRALKDVF